MRYDERKIRSDTRRGTMIVMRAESREDLLRKGACENASESTREEKRKMSRES